MAFLHGIEVIEDNSGLRPISTINTSIIAIVGTAPTADAADFPLDTPVRLNAASRDVAKLGVTGSLRKAVDLIADQVGATLVVLRVSEEAAEADTVSKVIGTTEMDGTRTGLQALLDADSSVGLKPQIIITPGFSHHQSVATAMITVTDKLQGFCYIDADADDTDAVSITYRGNFDSRSAMVLWPAVQYYDVASSSTKQAPASAVLAGVRARLDSDAYGFARSSSNQVINGITGTSSPVHYAHGDSNAQANLLNADEVSCIIRIGGGFRTWGNRTTSSDAQFAFESRSRIDYAIQQSLLAAHLWAVDRNITHTYFEDVTASVQAYLDELKSPKAQVIVDGNVWVDEQDNQPSDFEQGHATFRYDFADSPIAERITFIRRINSDYYTQLLEAS